MNGRGQNREPALTALLIAEDRALAQSVQSALAGARLFEVLSDLKSYPQEQTLEIRLRQIRPDVLLIDLATDFEAAAALIRFVAGVQPPIQVIGLHHDTRPEVLIPSFRAGVSEFLSAPFDVEAQREAAARIRRLREPEGRSAKDQGHIIAWTSAKPGSGASTLATQCAFTLRRLTGKRVLLVDMDMMSGSIAFALKLAPTYSILDAIERAEHLDPRLWSALTVGVSGLDVLAAPDSASNAEIDYSRLHDVFEYARVLYDWVVLDLPMVFHRLSLFALSESDQSFLVSTSELPSLHLARRAVGMLAQLGYGRERYQMVVNRMSRRQEISAADIEKIFTCPVFATVPNDYHALHKIVTRGEALSPDCEVGRAIEKISARVAGLAHGEKKARPAALETKPALSES